MQIILKTSSLRAQPRPVSQESLQGEHTDNLR